MLRPDVYECCGAVTHKGLRRVPWGGHTYRFKSRRLITRKGLRRSWASNTQRVKYVRGLVTHKGLRVCGLVTHKGLRVCRLVTHKELRASWAGHTQRVKSDVGWSHTKG